MRSITGSKGTHGISVYDTADELAFRVDNYSPGWKLFADELTFMDVHGALLLSTRPPDAVISKLHAGLAILNGANFCHYMTPKSSCYGDIVSIDRMYLSAVTGAFFDLNLLRLRSRICGFCLIAPLATSPLSSAQFRGRGLLCVRQRLSQKCRCPWTELGFLADNLANSIMFVAYL